MVGRFVKTKIRKPRRRRGSAMALYALFIAFVGVPLVVATADVTRLWLKRAQLAGAVEAACSAYVNAPDMTSFRDGGPVKLGVEARNEGYRYFSLNMPDGILTGLSYTVKGDSPMYQVVTAFCSGQAFIRPLAFMGLVKLEISQSTMVKAKFGIPMNWPNR
jgi:hypothetical protein